MPQNEKHSRQKNEENAQKVKIAPAAITKLENYSGEIEKLAKKETVAIVWVNYGVVNVGIGK